uniref:Uncharacterized protein n=1 Tax=Phage sp. ctqZP6 TaxID=2828010 RepID=A0A8S5SHW6_9VIRU|nr:MAG TPA: hypothetical protein [Phage sp. ctqZP6]
MKPGRPPGFVVFNLGYFPINRCQNGFTDLILRHFARCLIGIFIKRQKCLRIKLVTSFILK